MDTSVQILNRKICRTCLREYSSRKDLVALDSLDQTSPPSAKVRFYDMLSNVMHQTVSLIAFKMSQNVLKTRFSTNRCLNMSHFRQKFA